jgi:two-component system, OmpR family, response regulator VanR
MDTESSLGEELAPVLSEARFSVARASSYSEAISILVALIPDMIILNHTSDESLAACHLLHMLSRLPVILVGEDYSSEIWRKALLESEAEFYVRKPFDTDVLIARIKSILRRYRHMPRVTGQTAAKWN